MEQPRRRFFASNIPDELKLMNSTLNKVSRITFDAMLNRALEIDILEQPEILVTCGAGGGAGEYVINDEEDASKMTPVVKVFLSRICEDTETNNIIEIISEFFIKMKNRWKGRQGGILITQTIQEIDRMLSDYINNDTNNEEEINNIRRKCFCIVKFISYLYHPKIGSDDELAGIIPSKIIIILLEKFYKLEQRNIELFNRLLTYNIDKLKIDRAFIKNKFNDKYKAFLEKSLVECNFDSKKHIYDIQTTLVLL